MREKPLKRVFLVLPPAHKYLCVNSYTIRSYSYSIHSVLKSGGYAVSCMDFLDDSAGFEKFCENLSHRHGGPSIYIIVIFFSNRIGSLRLIKAAKGNDACKNRVVVSGPFSTINYDAILRKYPVDVVVLQEPENTMVELMKGFMTDGDIGKIGNIAYRDKKGICRTFQRIKSGPDALPFTSIDFYKKKLSPIPVWTYRGCPFACTFCDRRFMYGDKIRARSVETVIKELTVLNKRHGVKNVVFDDCNFILNKKRALELCRAIQRQGLKISWTCATRVGCVDAEVLRAMKSAGCKTIYYGIESGSNAVLRRIGKTFSRNQCIGVVKMSKLLGMRVGLFLMVGCPGETKETIRQTKKFLLDLYPFDELNVNPLVVLPGTSLFDGLLKKGSISKDYFFKEKEPLFYRTDWSDIKREIKPFLKFLEICPTELI